MKDVLLVMGAGQISLAITRRIGYGKKVILGDNHIEHAEAMAQVLTHAGFDVTPCAADLSSRTSIQAMIGTGQEYGQIKYLVNGAGVSPSQASIETILKVDLYGTAVKKLNK